MNVKDFKDRMKALKEEFAREASAALEGIFVAYPGLVAVHWQQFVPGHCDGEPCTFTLHGPNIWRARGVMTEETLALLIQIAEDDPRPFGDDDFESENGKFVQEHLEPLEHGDPVRREIQEMFSMLEDDQNVLETAYGDEGAEVVLFPGQTVSAPYDCGY